jgi:hypothetical protein
MIGGRKAGIALKFWKKEAGRRRRGGVVNGSRRRLYICLAPPVGDYMGRACMASYPSGQRDLTVNQLA